MWQDEETAPASAARSFFVSVIQQHSEISRVQTDKLKIRLERKDDCKDKKGGTLGSVDAFLRVSLRSTNQALTLQLVRTCLVLIRRVFKV